MTAEPIPTAAVSARDDLLSTRATALVRSQRLCEALKETLREIDHLSPTLDTHAAWTMAGALTWLVENLGQDAELGTRG